MKPIDGSAAAPARIVAPAPGTIVALDPDIPPAHQRLRFAAGDGLPEQALAWYIDGKAAGRGREWDWLPWPGRHRVQLRDARDQLLDETHIEVRGAGLRAARR